MKLLFKSKSTHIRSFLFIWPKITITLPQWALQSLHWKHPLSLDPQFKSENLRYWGKNLLMWEKKDGRNLHHQCVDPGDDWGGWGIAKWSLNHKTSSPPCWQRRLMIDYIMMMITQWLFELLHSLSTTRFGLKACHLTGLIGPETIWHTRCENELIL